MGSAAHLGAIESVQEAATEIARRPPGKVLFFNWEKKLKQQVERFIGLLYSFVPDRATEETYEILDKCSRNVIKVLVEYSKEPYYLEAVSKIKEASKWIARGYSPSHPPSDEELRATRERHTKRLVEVLSTEPP